MATTIRRHPRFNHCCWARARDALFWSDLDRIIPIHWKDSNSKSLAEGFPLSLEFWPIKVIFVQRQFKVYTIYTIVCWDPLTKIQIPCQPRRTTGQLHQPASSRFTKVRRCWEIIHLHIFHISTLVHSTALDTLHMVQGPPTLGYMSARRVLRGCQSPWKICLNVK